MSKKSKRPGREARDIHATIRADAAKLKAAEKFGTHDGAEFAELNALLCAYRDAIETSVPRSIAFEGRAYYGRVRLAIKLDVYAGPGDAEPLASALHFSGEGCGHAPGH